MSQARPPRRGTARATRRMAMCAVLAALAVVFLAAGALFEIMDLTAATVGACIMLLVLEVYGPRSALLTYAVTAVLGILLLPQSLSAWMFAGLVGYYPVLKKQVDRLPRLLAWLCKLVLFAAVMVICLLSFHLLFRGGAGSVQDSFLVFFGDGSGRSIMAWAVIGLSLFCFLLFDLLIDRLCIVYRLKWKVRLEKWLRP